MASGLPGSGLPVSDSVSDHAIGLRGAEPPAALPNSVERVAAPELPVEIPLVPLPGDEVLSADAVWLAEDDLPCVPRKRPAGPGVLESIGWIGGFYAVQFVAAIVGSLGLAVWFVARKAISGSFDGTGGAASDLTQFAGEIQEFVTGRFVVLFAVAGLATLLYSYAAVSLRLKRQRGMAGLGLHAPSAVHVLLIFAGTLPLSILCSELQRVLFTYFPQAGAEMTQLFKQMGEASFPMLLLVLAILPALGEELLFRGLIGRGLINRMGVGWGVVVTSVLFGLMHLNPGQALAVIPLGFAMHFTYLVTRSFWAPVLLHFLNNSRAAVGLKFVATASAEAKLDDQTATPWPSLAVSAVMVAGIGYALWRTRVVSTSEPDQRSPFDDRAISLEMSG